MQKRIVALRVHDDYGFLDEVCSLFVMNKLERADFEPVELHELVKVFVPIVMRQWNTSLAWDYDNNHKAYERDLEDLKLHRNPVFEIVVE